MTHTESKVAVTFHPQEWTDSSGQAHDWDRKQLIPAEEREPVTFIVHGKTGPTRTATFIRTNRTRRISCRLTLTHQTGFASGTGHTTSRPSQVPRWKADYRSYCYLLGTIEVA